MTLLSTIGALAGLLISILLIIKKIHPAYSLILGALIGGLIGGSSLVQVVKYMINGASSMMPAILRILSSGVLAGALIKTGAAEKIAESIVAKMGSKLAIPAIAISTMIICAVGVFVDISVITVAPIALAVGARARLPKSAVLLGMIGGGKAGNIISPNPNTIATAEAFGIDLSSLMLGNIIPAIFALAMTILMARLLSKRGTPAQYDGATGNNSSQLGLIPALLGPLAVIILLALRPLFGISIDPLIALPAGGLVCIIVTGNSRQLISFTEFGLSKVIGVAVLLIGTGTLAGVISASALKGDMVSLLEWMRMPAFALAPLSGILLASATASTTAGATIASQTFAQTLIQSGVPSLPAATMIHAGSTVLDSLPHGSFFHATAGSVFMGIKDRMRLIPYEACVGLCSTAVSVIQFLLQ